MTRIRFIQDSLLTFVPIILTFLLLSLGSTYSVCHLGVFLENSVSTESIGSAMGDTDRSFRWYSSLWSVKHTELFLKSHFSIDAHCILHGIRCPCCYRNHSCYFSNPIDNIHCSFLLHFHTHRVYYSDWKDARSNRPCKSSLITLKSILIIMITNVNKTLLTRKDYKQSSRHNRHPQSNSIAWNSNIQCNTIHLLIYSFYSKMAKTSALCGLTA